MGAVASQAASGFRNRAAQTIQAGRDGFRDGRALGDALLDDAEDEMDVMRTVQMIGGAIVGIAVIGIVLNELFSSAAVNQSSGPFSGIFDSLTSTGVAAVTLLVVGLLVAAASRILDFFGGGF